MTEIAAGTLENLRATTTATLTTQLFRRGFRNAFLQGVRPLRRYDVNLVGPAFTLRYIPAREDLDAYGAAPDPNALQREAIEAVPPGHVLVMDCRGEARVASGGDIYMTRLRAKGVAGVVSDGGIRDTAAIEKIDLPVYCAVPSAPPNRILHHTLDYNRPIGCGGVAVYPGDIVVGDADGIVIIPRAIADEVAHEAAEQERIEAYIQRRVADGEKLPGLYPANDAVRAQYEKWRAGQSS